MGAATWAAVAIAKNGPMCECDFSESRFSCPHFAICEPAMSVARARRIQILDRRYVEFI
jgi:hypothetical protein